MAHHTAASRLRAEVTKWFTESDGEPPENTEMEAVMHVLLNAPELCWMALEEGGQAGRDEWWVPTDDGERHYLKYRRYERGWREHGVQAPEADPTADPTAEGRG